MSLQQLDTDLQLEEPTPTVAKLILHCKGLLNPNKKITYVIYILMHFYGDKKLLFKYNIAIFNHG